MALAAPGMPAHGAAPKRPLADSTQIMSWWRGSISPFEGFGETRVIRLITLQTDDTSCIQGRIGPAISEWKRAQIRRNPRVDSSLVEATAMLAAIETCGATADVMTFHVSDVYVPSTVSCFRKEWAARTDYRRGILANMLFREIPIPEKFAPGLRETHAEVEGRCITQEDRKRSQERIEAALNGRSGTLPTGDQSGSVPLAAPPTAAARRTGPVRPPANPADIWFEPALHDAEQTTLQSTSPVVFRFSRQTPKNGAIYTLFATGRVERLSTTGRVELADSTGRPISWFLTPKQLQEVTAFVERTGILDTFHPQGDAPDATTFMTIGVNPVFAVDDVKVDLDGAGRDVPKFAGFAIHLEQLMTAGRPK